MKVEVEGLRAPPDVAVLPPVLPPTVPDQPVVDDTRRGEVGAVANKLGVEGEEEGGGV